MARPSTAPATLERPATPPAPRPDPPADSTAIRDMLLAAEDKIGRVLPKHMTPERVVTLASTVINRNKRLMECDRLSLYAAVIRASSLGLDLDPRMMEAYLIPRWSGKLRKLECNFQMGYQGVRKLAVQSGVVKRMKSVLVHRNDEFSFHRDEKDVLFHREKFGTDRGPIILCYSRATLADGEIDVEIMEVEEINRIRDRAKAANRDKDGNETSSPWDTDWGQMACKTVTLRHGKSLPRSTELAVGMSWDAESYGEDEDGGRVVSVSNGRPGGRGVAALMHRMHEPEFSSSAGVSTPLYSEDEPGDQTGEETPEGRQPGDD